MVRIDPRRGPALSAGGYLHDGKAEIGGILSIRRPPHYDRMDHPQLFVEVGEASSLTRQPLSREAEKNCMLTGAPTRMARKHIVLCLLLVVALLGMSIAAAAHTHNKPDVHEGQRAVCMSCAQMVAVCAVVVVALLSLASKTEPSVFTSESKRLTIWIPPAQRVRPPPIA